MSEIASIRVDPAEEARPASVIALANPIGAGLAHYTESLDHVLRRCGVSPYRVEVLEPSSADYGKLRWLGNYFAAVRREVTQDRADALIAVWPAVGYLDIPLLAVAGRLPLYLVMHDPSPLVYARGYGRVAKAVARRLTSSCILTHSPEAQRLVVEDARMPRAQEVLHPMLEPREAPAPTDTRRYVRVLGQYKVDRDVEGLERLASQAPPEWRLEIVGRGWPPIDGWSISNEFAAEERFDDLVRTSHAIVIPYERFFQSGVAIRALEWGVPVVGPHASSLQIALGGDCPWLVRDGDWSTAVAAAVREDRRLVFERACDLYRRVIADWSAMLAGTESSPATVQRVL
jgi:hypothetical protein